MFCTGQGFLFVAPADMRNVDVVDKVEALFLLGNSSATTTIDKIARLIYDCLVSWVKIPADDPKYMKHAVAHVRSLLGEPPLPTVRPGEIETVSCISSLERRPTYENFVSVMRAALDALGVCVTGDIVNVSADWQFGAKFTQLYMESSTSFDTQDDNGQLFDSAGRNPKVITAADVDIARTLAELQPTLHASIKAPYGKKEIPYLTHFIELVDGKYNVARVGSTEFMVARIEKLKTTAPDSRIYTVWYK